MGEELLVIKGECLGNIGRKHRYTDPSDPEELQMAMTREVLVYTKCLPTTGQETTDLVIDLFGFLEHYGEEMRKIGRIEVLQELEQMGFEFRGDYDK